MARSRRLIREASVGSAATPPASTLTRHCPHVPTPPHAEGNRIPVNIEEIDIGLVATSEVSVTMTTDHDGDLGPFLNALGTVGEIQVESDRALLGVVGRGIARATGVASDVLATLAEADIRVRVISQGALKVNVALVVRDTDVAAAVRALHGRFFA